MPRVGGFHCVDVSFARHSSSAPGCSVGGCGFGYCSEHGLLYSAKEGGKLQCSTVVMNAVSMSAVP